MVVRQMRDDVFQGFSNAELLLLLDATNGSVFTAGDKLSASCFVLGSGEDAIKLDKLDAKWVVNADAFMARLRNLTNLQASAGRRAVQRSARGAGAIENGQGPPVLNIETVQDHGPKQKAFRLAAICGYNLVPGAGKMHPSDLFAALHCANARQSS